MVKAVIFDMDGVIIDSEPVYKKRLQNYLTARHREFDEADLIRLAGASNDDNWQWISSLWHGTMTIEALKNDYHLFYQKQPEIDYLKILNPDFKDVVKALKERGIRISLASSSPLAHIQNVLKVCGIDDCFELIVSGEQFKQSKPHPEIYLFSMKQLGLAPSETVAVEDSSFGIISAKAAGVMCLALKDTRFHFDQSKADICLNRLREILDVI